MIGNVLEKAEKMIYSTVLKFCYKEAILNKPLFLYKYIAEKEDLNL